jgi:hypothetical protein
LNSGQIIARSVGIDNPNFIAPVVYNEVMRKIEVVDYSMILSLALLIFMTACSVAKTDNEGPLLLASSTLTMSPTINIYTFAMTPEAPPPSDMPTLANTIAPTEFPLSVDVTLFPVITDDISEAFLVCPPLEGESIQSLWEIVTDPYNPPPMGRDERHQGVDFGYYRRGARNTVEGVPIQAILPGEIAYVNDNRLPYGYMVIIETRGEVFPGMIRQQLDINAEESLYHLYAHMQELPDFENGDMVTCGQIIGHVGKTGYYIVEPHLHLEIRIGPAGQRFANMAYYDTSATQSEMESYLRWRTSGEFNHMDPMYLFMLYLEYQDVERFP